MPFNILCPGCSAELSLASKYAGKTVRCPQCRTEFKADPDYGFQERPAEGARSAGVVRFVLAGMPDVGFEATCHFLPRPGDYITTNDRGTFVVKRVYHAILPAPGENDLPAAHVRVVVAPENAKDDAAGDTIDSELFFN